MIKSIRIIFLCLLFLPVFHPLTAQTINLTGNPQYVRIGDLDISGNQITVEALVKFTGGVNIVSKHTGPANVNYLMRIGTFEITTTTQFYLMSNPYAGSMQPNTWYHVAGTYNGSFIRYYVNGCLIVQQAASGNIVQNDLITGIGNISSSPNGEQFYGEIDELRIWNIARTPAELTANMFDLPNPTSYANLKAYYKFDGNLTNLQGNAAYNGTWVGTPAYGTQPLPSVIPTFSVQSVTPTAPTCLGANDGMIAVSATGNNLQYSINNTTWQPGSSFSGLAAGNYTVYTRTPEGCVITQNNITIPAGPQSNASASNTGPICSGQAIQLNGSTTATGTIVYAWTGPNGYTSSVQNPTDATQTGTYSLTVTANGCPSQVATTTVTLKPTPSATATNPGPFCNGQTIQLNGSTTATGTISYAWTGPNGYTSSIQNPSNATVAGTYNLTVTADGCPSAVASTTVNVSVTPAAAATNSGPYCAGDAIQLTGSTTATGTNTFSWTGPNGYTSSSQNPVNAAAAGVYSLVVTSNGCPSLPANTSVTIKPTPNASASNTGPYCVGEAIQLNGSSTSTGISSFAWTGPNGFNSTQQNPTHATESGTYTLIVTNDGCSSLPSTTAVVILLTPVAVASNSGPYCAGESIQLTGSTSATGNNLYSWTGPGGFTSNAQNPANATLPGTYELVVTSDNCMSAAVTTQVTIHSNPTVTASNTGPYYLGQEVVLSASTTASGASYQWTGPNFISNNPNPAPSNAMLAGTYTVTLTDANGCTASSSTMVSFSNVAYAIVPNVFTPNGDGKNDLLTIQNEGVKELTCNLFNRWGNQVFEIHTPTGAWDGKSGSQEVSAGVYFYILEASDFQGQKISQKGYVHLVR